MRTTLNIDDDLMRRVKTIASETKRTITQVIEDLLRRELVGERPEQQSFRLKWVTVSGRVHKGVDLTDRDSLFEVMGRQK